MPAKASACANLFWYKCLVVVVCLWDSTGSWNLLAFINDVRCFSFYGQICVWSKWVSKIGTRWLTTVLQRLFFSRSMCTLRETNYWHEMWPTRLDLSQPPKIGWSRSHHMMIKILWYVDLLSFRPNSLTWSTNLGKHYFWVLKGNTTFNLVQGGTEVGGTEGVKGTKNPSFSHQQGPPQGNRQGNIIAL